MVKAALHQGHALNVCCDFLFERRERGGWTASINHSIGSSSQSVKHAADFTSGFVIRNRSDEGYALAHPPVPGEDSDLTVIWLVVGWYCMMPSLTVSMIKLQTAC